MCRALPPKMQIHATPIAVGTKMAPKVNSRMVRPREMRAMNMPTNGAQANHQLQ